MEALSFITKKSAEAQALQAKVLHLFKDFQPETPLVFAIGGDGTMLQAVKKFLHHKDAIYVGISAGSLGLLQTIQESQLPQLKQALQDKSYNLLKAPLLYAAYCRPKGDNAKDDQTEEIIGYAFNDISIERQHSRAAKFKLKIDDSEGDFIGDGVIFSTPVGSTAYSLAAGGPIIDSLMQDTFVITPNNPHISSLHSSLQRPHVLSKSRSVRVELAEVDKKDRPLQLALDGEVAARDISSPLIVRVADFGVRLLQLEPDKLHKQIEEKQLGRI